MRIVLLLRPVSRHSAIISVFTSSLGVCFRPALTVSRAMRITPFFISNPSRKCADFSIPGILSLLEQVPYSLCNVTKWL